MKFIKCPKCELNYMEEGKIMCDTCGKQKSHTTHTMTHSCKTMEEYKKCIESARSSASPWFFNKYLKDIEEHYEELTTDPIYKQEYIKRIFETEGRDSAISGTRVRVDSTIRFIKLTRELITVLEKPN